MTDANPPRPPARRSDPTRARILQAARARFARAGYDGTTIRAVAADARIDPSMVMRYFGSKDGLFAAAADLELALPDFTASARAEWGRRLVTHFFARWEEGVDEPALGLLIRSAATNPHAAERVRAIAATQIVEALARAGVNEPERRAALVSSQMLGLALCRYVLEVPHLVAASADQLVEDLGPTVQRYLTAPLASRSSS